MCNLWTCLHKERYSAEAFDSSSWDDQSKKTRKTHHYLNVTDVNVAFKIMKT